jgi:hypothetical protein
LVFLDFLTSERCLSFFLPFFLFGLSPRLWGSPGPAALIEEWTGGILRDIMILIRDGCRRAIEANRPCLEQPILEATWKDIQTQQVTDFLDLVRQREKR